MSIKVAGGSPPPYQCDLVKSIIPLEQESVPEETDLTAKVTLLALKSIEEALLEKIDLLNEHILVKTLGLEESSLLRLLQEHGTKITSLNISSLPIINLSTILALCPNIQRLSAKECSLKAADVGALKTCYSLECLDISCNLGISFLNLERNLSSLTNLTYLNISSTNSGGGQLYWIRSLKKLEYLDVSYNFLQEGDTESIASLRNLLYLDMQNCDLYMQSIPILLTEHSKLKKLKHLDLSKNIIEKEDLQKIKEQMPALEHLALRSSSITYTLPSLPSTLKTFDIRHNPLPGNDPVIASRQSDPKFSLFI